MSSFLAEATQWLDDGPLFREAVARTARDTGFASVLDYAVQQAEVDLEDAELISLARRKLSVPGTQPVQLTPECRAALAAQVGTELRPVLRTADIECFDLSRIWRALEVLHESLEE